MTNSMNSFQIEKGESLLGDKETNSLLSKIFKFIGNENKWCVEFGAVRGQAGSNTRNLLINHGWSGVLIECHPGYFKTLKNEYKNISRVQTFKRVVNFEGDDTLDNILSTTGIPIDFDLLSIDIDGADYHVWQALKEYKPRVVVIECNLRIPPSVDFVSPRDLTAGFGSSLLSLCNLGKEKGYELIFAQDMNAVFVRKDLFWKLNILDNRPETVGHFVEQNIKIFQAFNGSLVITGVEAKKILLFKKKPISPIVLFNDNRLFTVPYNTSKFFRVVKNTFKRLPFYYLVVDPWVSKYYGFKRDKMRERISNK